MDKDDLSGVSLGGSGGFTRGGGHWITMSGSGFRWSKWITGGSGG